MRRLIIVAAVAAAPLLGAACAEGTEEDLELDGDVPAEPAVPATDEDAGPTPGVDHLGIDSMAQGPAYLTDRSGRALYLLEGEPDGRSTCYEACAEEWPPYTVEGEPSAGTEMDTAARPAPDAATTDAGGAIRPGMLGTIRRTDGSTQLTYGGHALYYYHDDRQPGQTQGQDKTDAWGEWYLVTPEGEALDEHGSAS